MWQYANLGIIELSVYSDGSNQFPSQEGSQVQPVNNRIVQI